MGGGGRAGARAEDVWLRSYPYWDAYYAVVLAVTVVVVAAQAGGVTRGPAGPAGPFVAIGLLLVLALAYALVGRRAVRDRRRHVREARWYAAAMLVLFTAAVLAESASAIALSALLPMAFMSLPTAWALGVMVGLFAAPAAGLLPSAGVDPWGAVMTLGVGLPAGALLGTSIGRLSAQNRKRARLIEELDRTRDELARMSQEAGVLAERERLAGDIHDTLAQGFAGIIMLLQAAEAVTGPDRHLELAVRTAKDNLAETRALIAALAPPALSGASVEEALRRLAQGFGLPVEVAVGGAPVPLSPAAEVVVLRVAQEALANVRKHAGARSVRLALEYGDGRVRLTVSDDGRGLDPVRLTAWPGPEEGRAERHADEAGRAGALGGGFGVPGMRRRVAGVGGTLTLDGAPGQGTTVTMEVPCSPS
ncbi:MULTISPECIES: sensor histidine kinase [unclassified Nonomuraea]|uniref:sensor histidine kinase n=1 Tax=unclassified Nonomuraea TaxID=2593643 RepID=UPI0033C07D7E